MSSGSPSGTLIPSYRSSEEMLNSQAFISAMQTWCPNEELDRIESFALYIFRCYETWLEDVKRSTHPFIYKKASEDSSLLRSIMVEKDGTLSVHFARKALGDKTLGHGGTRKFHVAFNFQTEKMFAVGSCRKDHLKHKHFERECSVFETLHECQNSEGIALPTNIKEVIGKKGTPKIFIEGPLYGKGALIDLFVAEKMFSEKEKLQIAKNLLAGLKAIHNHGIVHRDIKPDNIFLDERNCAYISDFGHAYREDDPAVLQDGYGTVQYFSPEYAHAMRYGGLDKETTGKPNDIWALGCVLFQLCYDKDFPWGDMDNGLQFDNLETYPIDTVEELQSPCGNLEENPLQHLISEMLQVDRKKRITINKACDKYLRLIQDRIANL